MHFAFACLVSVIIATHYYSQWPFDNIKKTGQIDLAIQKCKEGPHLIAVEVAEAFEKSNGLTSKEMAP